MIQKIGTSAILAAVYTRLTTSAYMSGYTSKVYNNVPDTTAMPYIRIGEPMVRQSALFGNRDTMPEECVFTVHVWSSYMGDKEAADILTAVSQALTASALSITGYTTLFPVELEYSDVMVDDAEPAHPVRHGVGRFRAHSETT